MRDAWISPSRRFVCRNEEEFVQCYDLETGESRRIANKYVNAQAIDRRQRELGIIDSKGPTAWYDDHRSISCLPLAAPADVLSVIIVTDFNNGKLSLIRGPARGQWADGRSEVAQFIQVLPGAKVAMFEILTQKKRPLAARVVARVVRHFRQRRNRDSSPAWSDRV